MHGGVAVPADILIDAECEWDEDAIEEALAASRALMPFDEAGASQLLAQAHAAQQRLDRHTGLISREPYDPMRLYARMGRYYPWMSKEVIDRMPFPTFFGYVREASIMIEEEKAEYNRAQPGSSTPEQIASALDDFPRARQYQGETVAI